MKNVRENSADNSVIVVGGSSGIGYHTCLRFVNRGWQVTNISRTPCNNHKVVNFCADVTEGSALSQAIESSAQRFGLSALIYCAGVSMAAPIEHAGESDYKYLFEVNYFGALRAMQAAIPLMKSRGGKIVLVCSLGGEIPIVFDAFYSSSKAALEMLAREANAELNAYGIRVTAVLPGGTCTDFTFKRKVYTDEENKRYAKSVKKSVAALADMEQSGMKPSQVAEDIYKVVTSDKHTVLKVCGAKNTVYRALGRVMPEKMALYVGERVFHQ